MEGDEQQLVRPPARRVYTSEPVFARGRRAPVRAVPDVARQRDPDLASARRLEQLGRRGDCPAQVRHVVTRDAIIHDRDAIAVHGHASAEAVTEQNADQRSARQLGHSLAVLGSGFPRCSQRLERRVHGHRLELAN